MKLALIAAVARDGAIGKDNELLWRHRDDLQHFRRVTMGCPVVMGRKTWDSLPAAFKPLPGRRNVVVTRNAQWQAQGAERAGSLDEALSLVADAEQVFIVGGGELYAQALPLADVLELDRTGDALRRRRRALSALGSQRFHRSEPREPLRAGGLPLPLGHLPPTTRRLTIDRSWRQAAQRLRPASPPGTRRSLRCCVSPASTHMGCCGFRDTDLSVCRLLEP